MPEAGQPAGMGFPRPQPSQNAPMGVSPATGPTPNKGYEAAAQQKTGMVIKQLQEIAVLAGATELGKVINEVLGKLLKVVVPGSNSQASDRNAIDQMAMKNMQASQTNQAIRPPMPGGPGQGGQMGMAA